MVRKTEEEQKNIRVVFACCFGKSCARCGIWGCLGVCGCNSLHTQSIKQASKLTPCFGCCRWELDRGAAIGGYGGGRSRTLRFWGRRAPAPTIGPIPKIALTDEAKKLGWATRKNKLSDISVKEQRGENKQIKNAGGTKSKNMMIRATVVDEIRNNFAYDMSDYIRQTTKLERKL